LSLSERLGAAHERREGLILLSSGRTKDSFEELNRFCLWFLDRSHDEEEHGWVERMDFDFEEDWSEEKVDQLDESDGEGGGRGGLDVMDVEGARKGELAGSSSSKEERLGARDGGMGAEVEMEGGRVEEGGLREGGEER